MPSIVLRHMKAGFVEGDLTMAKDDSIVRARIRELLGEGGTVRVRGERFSLKQGAWVWDDWRTCSADGNENFELLEDFYRQVVRVRENPLQEGNCATMYVHDFGDRSDEDIHTIEVEAPKSFVNGCLRDRDAFNKDFSEMDVPYTHCDLGDGTALYWMFSKDLVPYDFAMPVWAHVASDVKAEDVTSADLVDWWDAAALYGSSLDAKERQKQHGFGEKVMAGIMNTKDAVQHALDAKFDSGRMQARQMSVAKFDDIVKAADEGIENSRGDDSDSVDY